MPALHNAPTPTEIDADTVLVSKVQSFVETQLRPLADEFERTTTFPSSLLPAIRQLGLFGLNIPKQYGGLEASRKTISLITEELSSGWISVASLVGSHLKVSSHIEIFGTEKQKEKFLPKMATGEIIAAHANMEKNNKSNDQIQTTISFKDEKFTIFGQKDWVLSSRDADMFAVSARLVGTHPTAKEDTILVSLVEKGNVGLSTGDDTPRIGVNGINLAPIVLNNCVVDTDAILGGFKHDGKDIIESAKKAAYIAYSSRAIGASRDLLERCKNLVQNKERTLVNEALENEPGVRNKLTYLDIKLAAAKSFLMKTIDYLNQDPKDEISPIQCKIFCTETAKSISLGVFKIFSAVGYTREHGIERIVRDIASLGIIGAPNYELLERIASKTLAAQKPNIEENVTLKYARLSAPQIPYKYFEQTTLGETMRIIGTENIKGVNVSYLDMTTGNPSGTFKDTLACLTLAYCLHNNIKAFCFSSSGNTGVSFAKYANKVGVKAILFYPKSSTYKLDHPSFGKNVTAVEVDGTEMQVKDILGRFSKLSGLPILPTLQNQIDGNKFRAHFLHEHYLKTGIQYDWHAQSVSSAMGPFGFYDGVTDIQQTDPTFKAPKFLAIQQEAVCPYVHRFGKFPENYTPSTEIIEPTLFRTQPTPDLYDRMDYILKTHGGQVDVLLNRELFQYQSYAIQKLQRKGIETNWVTTEKGPTMIESAGIICLSDVLKNIDQGKFEHGSSVLVGITGGQRKTPPVTFNPDHGILGTASDEVLLDLFKTFEKEKM